MPPINVAKVWEKVGYRPHRGQIPIHLEFPTIMRKGKYEPGKTRPVIHNGTRNRVVAAGRRFGKSAIGGHELIPEALRTRKLETDLKSKGQRREFWIVGPNFSDSEKEFRHLYNGLSKLQVPFDRPGTYYAAEQGNMVISLWNGAYIVHAKSAAIPDRLVGEGLSGVVMVEAAKMKQRVWTKYIRPTLADFKGWALFTSTPEGRNWFYELWQDGQDPLRKEWVSWRRPSWMNPYVYPQGGTLQGIEFLRRQIGQRLPLTPAILEKAGVDEEIVAMLHDLTEESFNQEVAADFSDFTGRVFKEWDEEIHVTDLQYDPQWTTYGAVDYGFTNPNVWLLVQVDPFGERMRILDEVYESGLTPAEFADMIIARNLCPGSIKTFFPDPAGPADTRTLENKLKVQGSGGTGGPVKERIRAIRTWLRDWPNHLEEGNPDRYPRLLIDRKCENTIREFGAYRYPERKSDQANAPEEPMKKDDHAPEALGRLFAGISKLDENEARGSGSRMSSVVYGSGKQRAMRRHPYRR